MNLTTVTFKGIDGNRASFDLPTDGVACASSVRSINTMHRNGMIGADSIKEYHDIAVSDSRTALEHGRNVATAIRGTLAGMSPVERANATKAMLKLRASVRF